MSTASRLRAKETWNITLFVSTTESFNALAVRESYSLPQMDESIYSLADARVFSTLDANSGYRKIKVNESHEEKTAFTPYHGLERLTLMPFGLKNTPATFQRVMDIILFSVKCHFALIYLEDIVFFS